MACSVLAIPVKLLLGFIALFTTGSMLGVHGKLLVDTYDIGTCTDSIFSTFFRCQEPFTK